jgi:hypothetical protein
MINETNYHLFLDDFVNGLLDEELEMDFVAFLDKHPNILEDESLAKFEAELPAAFKSGLKKEVPAIERNPDELLVASLEGDLSEKEEADLAEHIAATPHLQREKALFALTRLEADLSIKFPNKSRLRKRPVIVMYTRWAGAVAAVFILGMLLFRFLGSGVPQDNPEAGIFPKTTTPETPVIVPTPTSPIEEKKEMTAGKEVEKPNDPSEVQEIEEPQGPRVNRQEPYSVRKKNFSIDAPQAGGLADLAKLEDRTETGADLPLASTEQSVWQWAYKKVRARIGEEELIIPEKEIPRDAANLVLARVAPVFQYNQNPNGNSIRIGGLEINRRSAH